MSGGGRLRRNTAKIRQGYLFLAFFGACGWGAGLYSAADPNSVFTNTGVFTYAGAVVFLAASCALAALFWPFFIHVDGAGLTVRTRGATTWLPWGSVETLIVAKRGTDWSDPMLTIRVASGVRVKRRFGSRHEGRRVYNLLPLESFTVPPEQVIAILEEHSGGKVDAQDYLTYRAGKRAVAQWLNEAERGHSRSDDETGEVR